PEEQQQIVTQINQVNKESVEQVAKQVPSLDMRVEQQGGQVTYQFTNANGAPVQQGQHSEILGRVGEAQEQAINRVNQNNQFQYRVDAPVPPSSARLQQTERAPVPSNKMQVPTEVNVDEHGLEAGPNDPGHQTSPVPSPLPSGHGSSGSGH
ncbi:MAG: hypothetical protein KAJ63_04685, partial [Methyloprofundus sp.]|nr:hypothetical protein [Methyloprofundus sp.]